MKENRINIFETLFVFTLFYLYLFKLEFDLKHFTRTWERLKRSTYQTIALYYSLIYQDIQLNFFFFPGNHITFEALLIRALIYIYVSFNLS